MTGTRKEDKGLNRSLHGSYRRTSFPVVLRFIERHQAAKMIFGE